MSGIIVSRIEAANSPWQPWNDGTGKRIWFLARIVDGLTEYHWSKPDPHGQQHVIRYASYKTAGRAAERLNVVSFTPVSSPARTTCRHCDRPIEMREMGWASPDADNSDDDPYNCEEHDTFMSDHEPIEVAP